MTRLRFTLEWLRRRHLRRWYKEIALAVALTIAAAAFIAGAFLRGDGTVPDASQLVTARKPPTN
jgi:hypothetical protein